MSYIQYMYIIKLGRIKCEVNLTSYFGILVDGIISCSISC